MQDESKLIRQMSIDVAVIRTKLEETEKLELSKRVTTLEKYMNNIIGGLLIINFALGMYVAFKK